MEFTTLFELISVPDFTAVVFSVVSFLLIGWRIEHPSRSRISVTMLMADQHRAWMKVFVTRVPRIFDSQIVGILRQGTAFFASTSILVLGGLLALIGNIDPLRGVAEQVSDVQTPVVIWQLKLGLVAIFVGNAFLKFVWAHRVFGYGSILMAAVPNEPEDPTAFPRAAQAAELNIRAVINFNRGLRSLYFALGSIAWLLGAVALIVGSCIVLWMLWTREFASLPRTILLRNVS